MEYAQYNHTESESMFPPADPAHQIPSTFPLDHSHPFQAIDGGAMGSSCGPYDERQGYHGYGMTAAEEGGDATRGPRLTQEQLAHLEGEFARNSKPNTEYKKGLADRMGVELAKLNVSYCNAPVTFFVEIL